MFELSVEIFALLIVAGFVAGFIDSIAGGGGLITVPALLLTGMPPVAALATNKVQALFGSGMAAITYARAGQVDLRRQWRAALLSFAGAIIGAVLAASLPTQVIRFGLPILLIAVALFFGFKKGLSDEDRLERMSPFLFTATIVPFIGFYDGLVGPGTGSFFMVGFVMLGGFGILKATAHTKLLNFASNVGGLIGFLLVSTPFWGVGLAMGAAQTAGAYVGSTLATKIGSRLIRPLLVVTSTALALKLLYDLI